MGKLKYLFLPFSDLGGEAINVFHCIFRFQYGSYGDVLTISMECH